MIERMTAAIVVLNSFVLLGQPDPGPKAFEVASVRPHRGSVMRTGPLVVSSPLIRMEGYTVFGLVMDAYNVRAFQLGFGAVAPREDIYGAMYDIVARAPGDGVPGIGEVRAMVQTLLADRFKLKVHRETREMPVYALVPGTNGAKLKASSATVPCSVHVELASDGRNDEETFSNCPVEELADRLGNDRPVLDQTGLTGKYDFRLIAIPEYRSRAGSDPADIPQVTAVRELGLKLLPQRAWVEIIAVDHLERPGEN
jgi:uncharacterized protein (TIGR03435 family)